MAAAEIRVFLAAGRGFLAASGINRPLYSRRNSLFAAAVASHVTRSPASSSKQRRRFGGVRPTAASAFSSSPCHSEFEKMTDEYARAIEALNQLQSPPPRPSAPHAEYHLNLKRAEGMLAKTGMSMDDLDSLNVIHVAGTKGKGSTCAFCESVLRRRGLKTGLFTSPHLLSVRERICIDGRPIDKELFVRHFWRVYKEIVPKDPSQCRPGYFKFLTILALNIFWREGVDVAIVEVGIGGRYDYTNVVRKPVVCGITTLDYDHTNVLGKTMEEIAWQKAGIMKSGTTCFFDGCQPEEALDVIRLEAEKVGCTALMVPKLSTYDWGPFPSQSLGMYGDVFHRNASLALQMCRHFYDRKACIQDKAGSGVKLLAEPFKLDMAEAIGLRLGRWPGRVQLVEREMCGRKDGLLYFLDGAHTLLSVEACKSWFVESSSLRSRVAGLSRSDVQKVLVFNLTKEDRNAEPLLRILSVCDFDKVIFTPNVVERSRNSDNVNRTVDPISVSERCRKHAEMWNSLSPRGRARVCVFECIDEALAEAQRRPEEVLQVQVLVTGSLLLVGNAMQLIEPGAFNGGEWAREEKRITAVYREICPQDSLPNESSQKPVK